MIYNRAEKGELFDHLTDQVTLSQKKTRWETVKRIGDLQLTILLDQAEEDMKNLLMQIDRVLSAFANETSDITCSYLMKAKFNYLVLVLLFIENISNLRTIILTSI